MKTLPVNKAVLVDFMNQCIKKGIKYKLGAKVRFSTPVKDFLYIDCSGFVRWLLHMCSGVRIPDGSWNQRKYFEEQGYKQNPYAMVAGLKDNRLRIAFMNPVGGKSGHVWLVINGQTIESRSGKGVSRRRWNSPSLLNNVDYCFTITDVLN